MLKKYVSFLTLGMVFVLVGCQGSFYEEMSHDNQEQEQTGMK